MDLPLHQEGIDHRAEIVDHDVAEDSGSAGLPVDFDLADVAPVGIARDLRTVCSRLDKARLDVGREARRLESRPGNVA